MSNIGINYDLYRDDGSSLKEVTTTADLDLQQDLRDKDTNPEVVQEASVADQNVRIRTHVSGIYTTAISGHLLRYPPDVESMWYGGVWTDPYEGGSVIYRVYPSGTNPDDSKLYLEVSTADVA